MREIKFRAWDKTLKEMVFGSTSMVIRFSGQVTDGSTTPDVELMQFTGLLDRLGKEIFEGDILRLCYWEYDDEPELNNYAIHEVIWGGASDYPAFDLKPPIEEMNGLQACFIGGEDCPIWCEVIGNIYESPALLEGITQ